MHYCFVQQASVYYIIFKFFWDCIHEFDVYLFIFISYFIHFTFLSLLIIFPPLIV